MNGRIPPPNWLRAFESAARNLSFTTAAGELNVTQSAVSQQIRLLEQHLREPLFYRLPRGLKLTSTGESYRHAVHDAFERLEFCTREIFGHPTRERVMLQSQVAFATLWLAPRLNRFITKHPDISLRISLSVWNTDTDWDNVSLDFRSGTGNWPNWSDLQADIICGEKLFPVCAPELQKGPTALREPSDLKHHNLLHILGHGVGGWPFWLKSAGVSGITTTDSGIQVDSLTTALELAASGCGVALTMGSLTRDFLKSGRLVRPFAIETPSPQAYFMVFPKNRRIIPSAELFRKWVLDEAAQDSNRIDRE